MALLPREGPCVPQDSDPSRPGCAGGPRPAGGPPGRHQPPGPQAGQPAAAPRGRGLAGLGRRLRPGASGRGPQAPGHGCQPRRQEPVRPGGHRHPRLRRPGAAWRRPLRPAWTQERPLRLRRDALPATQRTQPAAAQLAGLAADTGAARPDFRVHRRGSRAASGQRRAGRRAARGAGAAGPRKVGRAFVGTASCPARAATGRWTRSWPASGGVRPGC